MIAVVHACIAIAAFWAGSWLVAFVVAIGAGGLAWWMTHRFSEAARSISQSEARSRDAAESERVRAELFISVLDAVDTPVIAIGSNGNILAANTAAVAFFAPSRQGGILNKPAEGLFESLDAVNAIREARAGKAGHADISILASSSRRTVRVAALPAAGGVQAVITLRDITEESRARRLTTDFVANASHELRTPLAAIRGAAETLSAVTPEETEMHDRLCRMIADNTTRIEDLTRDLLDLSRLESPDREVVLAEIDLAEAARRIAAHLFDAASERGIVVRVDADEVGTSWSDPRLLAMVLRNLVDNAIKFSKPDTEVVVSCRRSGGRVTWRVIDKGIGIPLDEQQRIFDRFYRVDPSRAGTGTIEGTGLGLALVRQAVDALGGTIRVDSVWGQGTTMIVELPDHPAGSKSGNLPTGAISTPSSSASR